MEWTQQRCFGLTCLFCYYGIKNAAFQLCQLHKKQNHFETQIYSRNFSAYILSENGMIVLQ